MLSSQVVGAASSSAAVKPHAVIAFRAASGANRCFIGVVASIPHVQQQDGAGAVLVQPRPLLSVPPQPSPTPPFKKGQRVQLTGQLVDRSDPAIAQLTITPLPSPNMSTRKVAARDEEANTIMTAEELQELQAQKRSLQADLNTSRARAEEINKILRQNAAKKRSPPLQASPSQPAMAPSITATPLKSAEDAVKTADAAERELLLSRAGLRTVKSFLWADLQSRTCRKSSQLLVDLIETSVMLLHDPQSAQFDDAVQQSPKWAKRLAAVKPQDLTDADLAKGRAFLKACPTVAAVEKEHKTAAALYRWLTAVLSASQAQRDLQGAQSGVKSPRTPKEAAAPPPANAASPDPAARDLNVLTPEEENTLRKECSDQLEYIQMATEEIDALDALIAEANALTLPRPAPSSEALDKTNVIQEGSPISQRIVPALTVPASWVVCAFAAADAPDMDACAAKPRGIPVTFSLPASHKLVAVVGTAATTAVPAITTSATAGGTRKSGVNPLQLKGLGVHRAVSDGEDRNSKQSVLPPTTVSSRRSSVVILSPQRSSPTGRTQVVKDAAAVSHPSDHIQVTETGSGNREAELEEKVRFLEARLSAALQQNPKEAELQLLRDEVNAKRTELQRVTEERDRLLRERREKNMWGSYTSTTRRKAGGSLFDSGDNNEEGGSSSPLQQPGSGRYTRQPSTPRNMVDRSIVDELEEQLTAAHQRISELQIEASPRRRCPSGSVGESNAADSTFSSPAMLTAVEETAEASAKAVASPPTAARLPARTVAQELYDELESRLQSVSAELETQRQSTQRLEEQLNSALHRRTEAESVAAAQRHELEEVWEKLEAAEARVEEQSLLTEQRFLMAQAQQNPSAQQQQTHAPASSVAASLVSAERTSCFAPQGMPPLPSGLPRPQMQSATTESLSEVSPGFVVPSTGDTEMKSQQSDDVATVVTGTAYGSISRPSLDAPVRSRSAEAFPTFGAGASMQPSSFHNGPYSRGVSASLQSRPVEQLSTIELRHEVHRLREEVERHQSGELRLAMDLQTLREKQKAERKRRRDARVARMQMLTRMQETIVEVIEKSNQELEAIPALLERGREEAEALMMKRRMHC